MRVWEWRGINTDCPEIIMYLCENRGENTEKNGFNKKGFSGVLRSEKIYFSRGKGSTHLPHNREP